MLLVSYSITKATNGQCWCLLYKARSGFLQNLMIKSRILSVEKSSSAPKLFRFGVSENRTRGAEIEFFESCHRSGAGCNFRRETKKNVGDGEMSLLQMSLRQTSLRRALSLLAAWPYLSQILGTCFSWSVTMTRPPYRP